MMQHMNDPAGHVKVYTLRLIRLLQSMDTAAVVQIARLFESAYHEGRRVFLMGNGGSGATASHIANDMNKGACFEVDKKFKVMSLTDCVPVILSLANDAGYETIFEEQLKNWAEPGDVVIGISGSGNSENVLRGIEYAKRIGCTTVGMTGYSGGKLRGMVDVSLHVPADDMQLTEDLHMIIGHILMQLLDCSGVCGRSCDEDASESHRKAA